MALHGYGRGRDVVNGRVGGGGGGRRYFGSFLMPAAVSASWCGFDPDDSFLRPTGTEAAESDKSVDEDDAREE